MDIHEVEKLLHKCEADLERYQQIEKEIKEIEENFQKLSDYYETQHLKDYENPEYADLQLACLDQDSIWNALVGMDIQRVALIKELVNRLR